MNDENKTAIKIKKLLALAANNPNEAERESALSKATEMMVRHQLSQSEVDRSESDPNEVVMRSVKANKRGTRKQYWVAKVVGEITQTLSANGSTGEIVFFGRADAVETASHMYDYLNKEFDRRWEAFRMTEFYFQGKPSTAADRMLFMGSMHLALIEKAKAQKEQLIQEEGLILFDELSRIKSLVQLGTKRAKFNMGNNANVAAGGTQAGLDTSINRQVNSGARSNAQKALA